MSGFGIGLFLQHQTKEINSMQKLWDFFCKNFLNVKFILFLAVGCINTLNSILLSYLFTTLLALDANLSFVIGYLLSLLISYLLNSFVTFRERLSWKKCLKFCVSYIPNFIIQNLCVILIYNILNLHKLIAYTCAAVIGIPVTYLLTKLFAFRQRGK